MCLLPVQLIVILCSHCHTARATTACVAQDEEAVQRLAERMRGLLEPFMLRRLKAEVAGQLAPKTQKVVQVSAALRRCLPPIFPNAPRPTV